MSTLITLLDHLMFFSSFSMFYLPLRILSENFVYIDLRSHLFISVQWTVLFLQIVAFLGMLVYRFYGEELREMFGYEQHPYGFYSVAGLSLHPSLSVLSLSLCPRSLCTFYNPVLMCIIFHFDSIFHKRTIGYITHTLESLELKHCNLFFHC